MDRLIAPGIWQIDTELGGWTELNAVFLIEGQRPCLVETGPQRDAGRVLAALAARGLDAKDLAYVVLTHIHLDHGGAVGEVAQRYPGARVICHPKGLRHLADPTRLVAAAGQVYGDRLDPLYGRMTPVDVASLVGAEDMQVLDLGGRKLTLVHSPGHAKHHIAILDDLSGVILVGDAVGVKVPGGGPLRPAMPPDDFDLELAIGSLHKFAALGPAQVVLTHFGPAGEPQEVLHEAEATMRRWCQVAESAYAEVPTVDHIERALLERVFEPAEDASRQEVVDTLNGFASNAAGMHGWLRRRAQASGSDKP
ncbi:MAG: MBL fold metallo-hydrolase [Candidatus Dormibacteraeota bacterium]|nr:MBL fold metallo-hydrolase [Candidatus Dormibacteraeota bacterium]